MWRWNKNAKHCTMQEMFWIVSKEEDKFEGKKCLSKTMRKSVPWFDWFSQSHLNLWKSWFPVAIWSFEPQSYPLSTTQCNLFPSLSFLLLYMLSTTHCLFSVWLKFAVAYAFQIIAPNDHVLCEQYWYVLYKGVLSSFVHCLCDIK